MNQWMQLSQQAPATRTLKPLTKRNTSPDNQRCANSQSVRESLRTPIVADFMLDAPRAPRISAHRPFLSFFFDES